MADEPKKAGQPTKYKPEYPEKLKAWMEKGYSFQSFAGHVRVNIDTLYEWERNNPEFSDAKKEAMELSRVFWESVGIDGVYSTKDGPNVNPTVYIFNMKNRFPKEWRDRHEVEAKVESTSSVEHKISEDIKPLIELFTKVLNDK